MAERKNMISEVTDTDCAAHQQFLERMSQMRIIKKWRIRMDIQKNRWHEVWEHRVENEAILKSENPREIFMELKRINGWDSTGSMLKYDQFYDQYVQTKNELEFSPRSKSNVISSVFEVGCGCGANLYLFQNDGYHVGGMDYSIHMIGIAGRVLANPIELICEEAANLSWEVKYDAVLSNSVFSYFDSYEYAEKTLEAMYNKANQSIGIIDIHNIEKEKEFIQFRKGLYQNYEERYRGLPKFFYEKSFFLDFAEKHNMSIKFTKPDMKDYWNNEFVFNCFMRKR